MTEKEAQDLLLGPTQRDYIERQLLRILQAIDNNNFIEWHVEAHTNSEYVESPRWRTTCFRYTIRERIK